MAIHTAAIEDPVTGETLHFEADTRLELDLVIDRHFGISAAELDGRHLEDGQSVTNQSS